MALHAAPPQETDHADGLFEHLEPHVRRRPAADDVLVQVLARAEAEEEPSPRARRRGRRLRDDRGMDADRRAGDGRAQAERRRRATAPITVHTKGLCPSGRSTGGSGRRSSRTRSPAPRRAPHWRRARAGDAPRTKASSRIRSRAASYRLARSLKRLAQPAERGEVVVGPMLPARSTAARETAVRSVARFSVTAGFVTVRTLDPSVIR